MEFVGLILGTAIRTFAETRLVRFLLLRSHVPLTPAAWLTFVIVALGDIIFLSVASSVTGSVNVDGMIVDVATLIAWLIYDFRVGRRDIASNATQPQESASLLRDFLYLFFHPTKLGEESVKDAFKRELRRNVQFAQTYAAAGLPQEERTRWYGQQLERVALLRRAIAVSLLILVAVIIVSFLFAVSMHSFGYTFTNEGILAFRLLSSGLILWATLGRLGWEIESYSGESLPERMNRIWFRALYVTGVALAAISIWEPTIR